MAGSSFVKQLTAASAVVGALVGGLYLLGNRERSADAPAPSAPVRAEPDASPLSLLPENAWLVVEFEGQLGNARPFGTEGPPCNAVPAPERVVFAVAPGATPTDELAFFLGSAQTSDAFFACATHKIVASGGHVVPAQEGLFLVESPSGMLGRYRERVLFSTSRGARPLLERLLRGPGASARSGKHGLALAALARGTKPPLALSLELPAGWLTRMDPEFTRSPLVALGGATLSITPSGGARGVVRCEPSGCAALAAFADRALRDLLAQIPPTLQPRFAEAVRISRPIPGAGELQLDVTPGGVGLGRYLLGSWDQTSPIP